MRLDKYLVEAGVATRTEATKAARSGLISVNGVVQRKTSSHVDTTKDIVTYKGEKIVYREFTYIMLNKPEGYVSATEDGQSPTVLTLLPSELQRIGLFPCGRLDKNTLGLMLLTNNGPLSHKLLAPKNHVSKKYRFTVEKDITDTDIKRLTEGVDIGGYITSPCILEMISSNEGYITLTEGKYHQIKLMMKAVCNKILSLERVSFGPLILDTSLERGEWRYLNESEISELELHGAAK